MMRAKFIMLAAILMLLSACSREVEPPAPTATPITLSTQTLIPEEDTIHIIVYDTNN